MSVIESLTIMLALAYIGSQLAFSGRQYGAWATAALAVTSVIISLSMTLLLSLLIAAASLLVIKFAKPEWLTSEVRINPLRKAIQHLLCLSLLLVALQYSVHLWQLSQGIEPWLARPNVVDAFLPIAAGIQLRTFIEHHALDVHHPAALVMLVSVLLTGLICKRAFCGWACPLGLAGEYLYQLRKRAFPRDYTAPAWIDWPLRMAKYLLLTALLYIVVLGLPSIALPNYLASGYHKMADVKMAYFFLQPTTVGLLVMSAILLIALWRRQGFCRYICPYGALLGIVSVFSLLKVRRQPMLCLNSQGLSCDKCSRACPANIAVHRLQTVHSDECQACLRCVAACPKKQALGLRWFNGSRLSHRGLGMLLLTLLLVVPLLALLAGVWNSQTPIELRMYLLSFIDQLGI
ncbi:4Fe-4S binding protein [Shewanella sp. NIFS-20-20]|uniref:4Fe-4S binding protein n=1 Tax=Shewanella sp. NIFS-20-20 TaxID=2853806 RepID=UPI001C439CE0|nr:4Fe-4S binding protein [Shewanella sp. NIFS-20-20]MBV7315614.1 4Fe-4S binding protein [Shewanella sp. NIFS-20-20]